MVAGAVTATGPADNQAGATGTLRPGRTRSQSNAGGTDAPALWGRWDSNPHCNDPKSFASCRWATAPEPPRPLRRRALRSYAQLFSQARDVTGGLHVVVGPAHHAAGVDHEGGPDHAHGRLAVELLLPVRAVRLLHRVIRVGQQREGQVVAVAELGQLGWLVGRDAEHRDARRRQGTQVVAEIARLGGAAGGHRRRVEVDDHLLPAQGRQAHRLAVGVGQGEVRRLVPRRQLVLAHARSLQADDQPYGDYRTRRGSGATGPPAPPPRTPAGPASSRAPGR